MILQRQLLSAENINNAFLSKTATGEQSINSSLKLGGSLVLKTGGSLISDDFNSSQMQIDPQGSHIVVFDGVNNQKLSVFSSDGSKGTYLTTLSSENYGLIDVVGVNRLDINTNSGKNIRIPLAGMQIGASATATDNFVLTSDTNGGGRGLRVYNGNYGSSTLALSILSNGYLIANNRVGINNSNPAYHLDVNGDIFANGWLRTSGSNGWYSQTYGGGWYMQDTTWVRAYNGKSIFTQGNVQADGNILWGSAAMRTNDFSNFNDALASGWYQGNNVANTPQGVSSGWWHLLNTRHNNPANHYAMQFAGDFYYSNNLFYRATNGNGASPWKRIFMEDSVMKVGSGRLVVPVGTDKYAT